MKNSPYIKELPNSKNAIVFIHSVFGSPRHFDGLVSQVPKNWSIFNISLAGHGSTPDVFASASMANWRFQVEELLTWLEGQYENIVITGHSVGALLALEYGDKFPHVKHLLLLSVPLRIFLSPKLLYSYLQVITGKPHPNNERITNMQQVYGIEPDRDLRSYIKWIPNCWTVLRQSARMRKKIRTVQTHATVFHAEKDELVCSSTRHYFPAHFRCHVLPMSGHHWYTPSDYARVARILNQLCLEIGKTHDE